MSPEEKAELEARRAANEGALLVSKWWKPTTSETIVVDAELSVQRRLIAATLSGGLEEYWRLVEQEIRR